GIDIVKKRGEFMQNLVPEGQWSMAAIIGMEEKQIDEICKSIKSGFVTPANYNCVRQIAISGEKVAVEEAMQKAK
ncbi:MAG: [acyl-carrier-protein] S-malonyltransferase, partial [Muribaculaceae bacterium]|nr:[acyl-carrier-protein] S-malonyltransferase [Muribaculaceae bacterium]